MSRDVPRLSAILGGFFLFTAILAALYALSGPVPFIGAHLTEIYAVLFLFLPHAWNSLTGFPVPDFGPPLRGVLAGLVSAVVVAGFFTLAYKAYFHFLCEARWPLWSLGRRCSQFHAFSFPGAMTTARLFLVHAVAVALPEEYFYRGFLQPLIRHSRSLASLSPRKQVLAAILLQAFLFACGHALVDFNPLRFSVFFPGLLFGWLTVATRGLWAPILLHAAANVLSETLEAGFFG